MKYISVWFAVALPLLADTTPPLKAGEKYDFIATDGQNIYGAVFLKETKKSYYVKAAGFGDELLVIDKSDLAEPPRPFVVRAAPGSDLHRWSISLMGDGRLASGDFSNYATLFPGISLKGARTLPVVPYLRINSLFALASYNPVANTPRRIDIGTLALGPQWIFRFRNLPKFEFFVMGGPAISLLKYKSYTFDSVSYNVGGIAAVGADWLISKNLFANFSLGTHYVHDKNTVVLLHFAALGVGYSF